MCKKSNEEFRMDNLIKEYIDYIENKRKLSSNTVSSYRIDLKKYRYQRCCRNRYIKLSSWARKEQYICFYYS